MKLVSFLIETEERSILIRADDEQDKDRWVRSLTMQIDLVRGGSGDGLVVQGRSSASQKTKVDRSLESEIDRTLVLIKEFEKVEQGYETKCSYEPVVDRVPLETKQDTYVKASRVTSHSNDVIALNESDISRDSF